MNRPQYMFAGRTFLIVMADLVADPYERARRLFNLGVRGNYSRKSIRGLR